MSEDFRGYSEERLDDFLRNMPTHKEYPSARLEYDRRQKLKDDEAAKKRDKVNTARHEENQSLYQKTLFWARIGGIAAAVGTIVVLLADIHISKFPPSTSSPASPTSSPQTIPTAAPSRLPLARVSASTTPQASLTPELSATPK